VTNWTWLKAEYPECPKQTTTQTGCPTGADVGSLLLGIPRVIGNLAVSYAGRSGVSFDADWHFVDKRYSTFPDTTLNKTLGLPKDHRNALPTYTYLNLGAQYVFPTNGVTIRADLLNVYQSKGLEEGNPRLSLVGGLTSRQFLARPILPRAFQLSVGYKF